MWTFLAFGEQSAVCFVILFLNALNRDALKIDSFFGENGQTGWRDIGKSTAHEQAHCGFTIFFNTYDTILQGRHKRGMVHQNAKLTIRTRSDYVIDLAREQLPSWGDE